MAHDTTAHFGINRYTDLTPQEFQELRLNRNMSLIVGSRLKSIQSKPIKNVTATLKINDVKYEFTDNNESNRYKLFYKPTLLQTNLNYIPMSVDW